MDSADPSGERAGHFQRHFNRNGIISPNGANQDSLGQRPGICRFDRSQSERLIRKFSRHPEAISPATRRRKPLSPTSNAHAANPPIQSTSGRSSNSPIALSFPTSPTRQPGVAPRAIIERPVGALCCDLHHRNRIVRHYRQSFAINQVETRLIQLAHLWTRPQQHDNRTQIISPDQRTPSSFLTTPQSHRNRQPQRGDTR